MLIIEQQIEELLKKDKKLIIAIDGKCAAGKSSLANHLSNKFDCNIFRMDDFFLRDSQRSEERINTPGENIDHERFLEEVLLPLFNNQEVIYRRYDCHTHSIVEPIIIEDKKLNIVEGSYSMHPEFREYYDLMIFLDISNKLQKQRLKERNPSRYETFINKWIPLENKYINELHIKDLANILIESE